MKIILILLILALIFGRRDRGRGPFSGLFTLMGLGIGYVIFKIFLFFAAIAVIFGGLAFLGFLL